MNRCRPSNFTLLEREFADIILSIRDGDSSGMKSSAANARRTISFIDGTRMYVTERIVNGFISYYYYNWVSKTGSEILKFHSEPHDDPRYQTVTEPYHIHPASHITLTNQTRLPNFDHQELHSLLEAIRIHILAQQAMTKE